MSSGWAYLQPDFDSDGEGEYSPVTLPGGQLVCYRHLQIICFKCCVDYSFMSPDSDLSDDDGVDEDDLDDNMESLGTEHSTHGRSDTLWPSRQNEHDNVAEDSDAQEGYDSRKRTRGTGRVIPTKFNSPSPTCTPARVFENVVRYDRFARFIHRQEPGKALIFTDGACINSGQANPKAGWAFVYGQEAPGDPGSRPAYLCAHRLEAKGPFGDAGGQTSNRAEMRAVLAALRFRHWPGEGLRSLVIATDSEYVVEGATAWVRGWVRNGWRTRNGGAVKNRDLWECLLGDIERVQLEFGMKVEFWRIPRELNDIADAAAKAAAEEEEVAAVFQDFSGALI